MTDIDKLRLEAVAAKFPSTEPIGWMVGFEEVYCKECIAIEEVIWNGLRKDKPITYQQVYPFKQTCHECDKVLVEGQKGMCVAELYPKRKYSSVEYCQR